jgi:hypothetical protein
MDLRRDERAPKVVSDDLMGAIGPNRDVRRLEGEAERIKARLEEKHGRVSAAPGEEQAVYTRKRGELRTARQKHRRKAFKMIYKDYFQAKDEEELQKQLRGSENLNSSERSIIPCHSNHTKTSQETHANEDEQVPNMPTLDQQKRWKCSAIRSSSVGRLVVL